MMRVYLLVVLVFVFSCSSGNIFNSVNGENNIIEKDSFSEITTSSKATYSATRSSYVINEISNFNSFITDSTIKSSKYVAMRENAFSFYRATNYLYFKDINSNVISIPSTWKSYPSINIWCQGDFHCQNIGFFQNNNNDVKFDLNDFDESYIAPYYVDVIRYCVSIYLMSDLVSFSLSSSDKEDLCKYFLEQYELAVNTNSFELTESNLSGFMDTIIDKVKSDNTLSSLLKKWTKVVNGKRIFDFALTDLKSLTSSEITLINNGISSYLTTNAGYSKYGSSYYKVKDKAKRMNSGLGSFGLRKYYVLIEGKTTSNDDDLILELKEQVNPSMFFSSIVNKNVYNTYLLNNSKRVFTATKALLKNVEYHAGYFISGSNYFTVKNISPYKYSLEAKDISKYNDFKDFIKYSAISLGFAHKRSDNGYNNLYISYVFKDKLNTFIMNMPNVKTTIISSSKNYSDQVKIDYTYFKNSNLK